MNGAVKMFIFLVVGLTLACFILAAVSPEAFGIFWDNLWGRILGGEPGDYRPDNTY